MRVPGRQASGGLPTASPEGSGRWPGLLLLLLPLVIVAVADCPVLGPANAAAQYPYPYPPPATACCTQFGKCPIGWLQPPGSPCYCPSPYGPVSGIACY